MQQGYDGGGYDVDYTINTLWGIVHILERVDPVNGKNALPAIWAEAFREAIRCVELVHGSEKA